MGTRSGRRCRAALLRDGERRGLLAEEGGVPLGFAETGRVLYFRLGLD